MPDFGLSDKLPCVVPDCDVKQNLYREIPLFRPPKIKTSCLLKTLFIKLKLFLSSFSTHSVPLIRDHFGTVQKWSLRPLLDSLKGGLNIGSLLYFYNIDSSKED